MTDADESALPLVLITRPNEDAGPVMALLNAHGMDGQVEPMLRIEPLAEAEVDLGGCQAILFTSANGVRALATLTDARDLPAMTVGPASARAAREAGFEDVEAAGGDVEALIDAVKARFPVTGGALFHAAGSVTAGDLKGALEEAGYTIRRVPLYRADTAVSLSRGFRVAWDSGRIDAVAFFSPRTASTFVRLLEEEGRASRARTVRIACLSDAVAQAAGSVNWAGTLVASSPESETLVAELAAQFENDKSPRAGTMAEEKENPETEATPDTAVAEPVDTLNTDAVIEAFGGIRPMASKLDVAVSTVQGWKTRAHIPEARWRDIIAAADAHSVDLSVALVPAQDEATEGESAPEADVVAEDEAVQDEHTGASEESEETGRKETGSEEAGSKEAEPENEPAAPKETRQATEEATAEAAPAAPQSGGGKLALLIGVAAIAAVVTRPAWAPFVDPHVAKYLPVPVVEAPIADPADPAPAPAVDPAVLAALNETIGALQSRIDALEARPATAITGDTETPVPVEIPQELLDRLSAAETALSELRVAAAGMEGLRAEAAAALEETKTSLQASLESDEGARNRLIERLGVMESRLKQMAEETERAMAGVAGLEAVLASQSADIAALERRPAIEGAAQAGLALAVGDVEASLNTGRPFADALARMVTLGQGDAAILDATGKMQPYAAAGVPTRAALSSLFRQNAALMQTELGKVEGGTLETLLNGAQSLISIRRKGDDPEAPPVSRAEAALSLGDLAGAVAALTPVRDGSAAVSDWLAGAEARLATEAALSDLRRAVAFGLNGDPTPEAESAENAESEATVEGGSEQ